ASPLYVESKLEDTQLLASQTVVVVISSLVMAHANAIVVTKKKQFNMGIWPNSPSNLKICAVVPLRDSTYLWANSRSVIFHLLFERDIKKTCMEKESFYPNIKENIARQGLKGFKVVLYGEMKINALFGEQQHAFFENPKAHIISSLHLDRC
ncbi:hypothetical protein ACJX0J_041550, partial [Zea mays]